MLGVMIYCFLGLLVLLYVFVGILFEMTNKKPIKSVFFEFQINDENVFIMRKQEVLRDIKEAINDCLIDEVIKIKRIKMTEEEFAEVPEYEE